MSPSHGRTLRKRCAVPSALRREASIAIMLCCSVFVDCQTVRGSGAELNVTGLDSNAASAFTQIFMGREPALRYLDEDALELSLTLDGYLTVYGLLCSEYLPPDKVEIKFEYCSREAKNDEGQVECVQRDNLHTHVYIDKNIKTVKDDMEVKAGAQQVDYVANSPSPYLAIKKKIADANDPVIRNTYVHRFIDSGKLVELNGCQSPQLRRFQENLLRYVTNQPLLALRYPMVVPKRNPLGSSPPLPSGLPSLTGVDYKKQDYGAIVMDMTKTASKLSPTREILPDSLRNYKVLKMYPDGTPSIISMDCKMNWAVDPPPCAMYLFFTYGRPIGAVMGRPGDQIPTIMTLSPSEEMIAKFETGGYTR